MTNHTFIATTFEIELMILALRMLKPNVTQVNALGRVNYMIDYLEHMISNDIKTLDKLKA
jgi:hypothetical protein